MSTFKYFSIVLLMTFTFLTLYASTLSEDLKNIEKLEAQEIAEAEGVDKKNTLAVLIVVTNLLMAEGVDKPTVFNLTTFDGPRGKKGLEGTITDADGIASVKIEYSNGNTSNYTNGDIDKEGVHSSGVTYTIT